MNKILQALKSKTVWTVVLLFVFNGFTAIKDVVPANYQPILNGVLAILAILFKLFPSQTY